MLSHCYAEGAAEYPLHSHWKQMGNLTPSLEREHDDKPKLPQISRIRRSILLECFFGDNSDSVHKIFISDYFFHFKLASGMREAPDTCAGHTLQHIFCPDSTRGRASVTCHLCVDSVLFTSVSGVSRCVERSGSFLCWKID